MIDEVRLSVLPHRQFNKSGVTSQITSQQQPHRPASIAKPTHTTGKFVLSCHSNDRLMIDERFRAGATIRHAIRLVPPQSSYSETAHSENCASGRQESNGSATNWDGIKRQERSAFLGAFGHETLKNKSAAG
jgi:hypothetical protein